jgi:hypothetical protein
MNNVISSVGGISCPISVKIFRFQLNGMHCSAHYVLCQDCLDGRNSSYDWTKLDEVVFALLRINEWHISDYNSLKHVETRCLVSK